ncbi:hypothetical protein JKP88DRAFT_250743 [Tribonema minus]|uniref:Uncharacterized protein n=1 Tax=Tribonema minus TaxID=303371 RepID=A0A835ZK54_9STRA|nr:hypothetical protein JKP88DRAFT_250743 [Tribonema minus]
MRDLRSTGFEWERQFARNSTKSALAITTEERPKALQNARSAWLNGTHPARLHLLSQAPAPWSLLKQAGAGVIVVVRTIICFLGITTVEYSCLQQSLGAEVALSYVKKACKKKKAKTVSEDKIVTHTPKFLHLADIAKVTPKMNVQLVTAVSNTHIIKYCNSKDSRCQIGVSHKIPSAHGLQAFEAYSEDDESYRVCIVCIILHIALNGLPYVSTGMTLLQVPLDLCVMT